MRSFASIVLVAASFAATAKAHFQLQWPGPRGPFNAANEVNFCDSFTDATTNRTDFPLGDTGLISLRSGHSPYTVGAIISLVTDADSFDDFKNSSGGDQIALQYQKVENNGTFCASVNLGALNIDGIKEGANATIQIVYSGGDGNLYQCADVVLRANATVPEGLCSNTTASGSASGSVSATASAPSSSQSGNAAVRATVNVAAVLGFIGVLVSMH